MRDHWGGPWPLTEQIAKSSNCCFFQNAAIYGHLGALQWLHREFPLTPSEAANCLSSEVLFVVALYNNLEVFRWLHKQFHYTAEHIKQRECTIFKTLIENGHLKLLQWIQEEFPHSIDDVARTRFDCCDPKVAEWVQKTFGSERTNIDKSTTSVVLYIV